MRISVRGPHEAAASSNLASSSRACSMRSGTLSAWCRDSMRRSKLVVAMMSSELQTSSSRAEYWGGDSGTLRTDRTPAAKSALPIEDSMRVAADSRRPKVISLRIAELASEQRTELVSAARSCFQVGSPYAAVIPAPMSATGRCPAPMSFCREARWPRHVCESGSSCNCGGMSMECCALGLRRVGALQEWATVGECGGISLRDASRRVRGFGELLRSMNCIGE